MNFKILFKNPNRLLKGEGKSKFLDENSDLYKWLKSVRESLEMKYGCNIAKQRMDFHIELVSTKNRQLLIERSKMLHGMEIEPTLSLIDSSESKEAKALVIMVLNYHITVAYFPHFNKF